MKEWYTSRELAEMALPEMPTTIKGILKKAEKQGWSSRERQGRGGGREYHIQNLPEAARTALISKTPSHRPIETSAPLNVLRSAEQGLPVPKPSNEDRKNARIVILSAFEGFLKKSGHNVTAAEYQFLEFYAAEARTAQGETIPRWVAEIYPSFSLQSLRLWRSLKKKDTSLAALGTRYGNKKGTGLLDQAHNGEVATYIVALITKQSHLTGGHVRDLVRSRFGRTLSVSDPVTGEAISKPLPNIRTFVRWIAHWKQDNGDLWLKLTDPDAYKNKFMIAFGKADDGIERLNQMWQIDASPTDALCVDGRYTIYALIDVFSRKTLFLVTKTPRTEASLLLIRRAILEWGVPEIIKTDNGSDFKSKRFMTALPKLGITHEICTPFSPEQKPFVERVIGTLQRDLMPVLPGFIGHSVADRKKIEATKAFSQRLGQSDKAAFAIQMTSEQLQNHIDDWAEHKYGHSIHGSLGCSPFEMASRWRGTIKKIENPRALDLLLAPIASGDGFRTVTKTGIKVEGAEFIAPELAIYVGKKLFVRHDPVDMGRIYLFDNDDQFICEAYNANRRGLDRNAITAMGKATIKHHRKELEQEIKRIGRGIKPEDMINDYLHDHIEKSRDVVAFPKPSETHTSPALTHAGRATKERQAPVPVPQTERQKQFHAEIVRKLEEEKTAVVIKTDDKFPQFTRALNLEARIDQGLRISDDDQRWLEGYRTTPQYRTQKAIREDFGPTWFEKKET